VTYSYTQISQYLSCPPLQASLPGWLEGERHAGGHAVRPGI
jgi:hypothetical protein